MLLLRHISRKPVPVESCRDAFVVQLSADCLTTLENQSTFSTGYALN
jgi:hypothetical protein